MPHSLSVKNMVCDRCVLVVSHLLKELQIPATSVQLGTIEFPTESLPQEQFEILKTRLEEVGFELINDRKSQITEQIKLAIIALVHQQDNDNRIKLSEYLSRKLYLDYPYLSKIFSEETGTTIEQYSILQKIERVKELLTYGELTLSEIAWQMGYSSLAALSSQFKKVTGVTPTQYKETNFQLRNTIDKVGSNEQ